MITFPKYAAYRDSGVDWLGTVPKSWTIKRLKFLGNIKTGEKDTADRDDNAEYPFFVRSQTVEKINTYSYNEEAVLTAGDGAGVGKVFHYINGKFDYHQRVYKVSNFREISGKYFYYYIKANLYAEVIRISAKSTVESLRLPMFMNFPVAYGDLQEQTRIVEFLDRKTAEIDEAIAHKQRLIELLQEQKAILINRAVTKGLNPSVSMRDSGVDWIGEIPAHWDIIRNRYIFGEQNERSQDGSETHLSMSQKLGLVPSDELTEKTLQSESYEGAKLCRKGDLVLNRLKAHLGVFSVSPCDGLVSPDYSVFRLMNASMTPEYFESLFKTRLYISEFNKRVKGIVVGFYRLYTDAFYDIPCICPPEDEQRDIRNRILQLHDEFNFVENSINFEINKLNELKQTLISESVTGKIKV